MAVEDESFAAEVTESSRRVAELTARLSDLLAPPVPYHADDTLIELWRGDDTLESDDLLHRLAAHYLEYAREQGWTGHVVAHAISYERRITLSVTAHTGTWPAYRYESGLHVMRRPRLHDPDLRGASGAVAVLAYPACANPGDFPLRDEELTVEHSVSYGGCGGLRLPTLSITHVPSGLTVRSVADDPWQTPNHRRTEVILRARLRAIDQGWARATDFGNMRVIARTDAIRTYDERCARLVDHRIGLELRVDSNTLSTLVAALDAHSEPPR